MKTPVIIRSIVILFIIVSHSFYVIGQEKSNIKDELFMRFVLGFGPSTLAFNLESSDMIFKSTGTLFRYQLGKEVSPNFILFGDLGGFSQTNPDLEWKGSTGTAEGVSVNTSGFGFGATYFFMPANAYVSGSLVFPRATVSFEESKGTSQLGVCLSISAGKEWWIGEKWAMGANVFVEVASLKDKEDASGYKAPISSRIFGISFTATRPTITQRQYHIPKSTELKAIQTATPKGTIEKPKIEYTQKNPGLRKYHFERKSDVNKEIPQNTTENKRRFALIIGNEDYSSYQTGLSSEVDVHFARNDASAFKEYAMNVFGIPQRNITFLLDATTGQMRQAINRVNTIIKNTYGEAEVFVFYAGHGLPDENSREPFLMPVDVSGKHAKDGIRLSELFHKLTKHPSKRITVFIDACFSGGARDMGLLAARGVKLRPKDNILSGNIVVFAGSSGEETALPYNEQYHGFFTYFLLKALKDKGPNISYGELSDYLERNIKLESVLINDKEQSPKVNVSPSVSSDWEEWTFK